MKITIHRGTNQIGGCITEIESNGYKVFIDFGEQLPGTENANKELPPIEGLICGDVSKSALFISHYHGDHIGKICDAVAELPIYVGKTALEIYNCLENRLSKMRDKNKAEPHKKMVERIKTIHTFDALQKIKIDKITVTPLWVDHSAFDAYMFIVEADGKQILHTGDFRGHGFRSKGLLKMLKVYAKKIDYIISEGSNILRPKATIQTEQELQRDFETQFKNYKYNFVLLSSTNIDRIFALYHAAKKAKRCFVCDEYQASILKIVSENHKKHTPFYDIDFNQTTNTAGRIFELKRYNAIPEKLKKYMNNHGFCMLIRENPNLTPTLDEYAKFEETKIVYSMWNGYLNREKTAFSPTLFEFLKPYQFEYKHTSGHADVETLKAVYETVNPKHGIIPIHTENPEKFKELFSGQNIILLQDGEIFFGNSEKLLDKLDNWSIIQLDDFILIDYRKKKKIDKELEKYLSIRKLKINKAFEWTPENMEKLLCLNQKFIDCWEKLYNEAQTLFRTLQKRVDEKDNFLHDFEIEAKVESNIYILEENGELNEVEDCIEEVLIESLRLKEICCVVNRTSFNNERCFGDGEILYLNTEQNWNTDPYFRGKFDNHFISQAIHDLYDHTYLSFPDILKINSLWAELEVQYQHFQDFT